MARKIFTNKYMILFSLLVIILGITISENIATSTTNAKYKTLIDANSSVSTIAKWDIKALNKDKTEISMTGEGFNLSESGDSGNWFFTISNLSEVNAKIAKSSKITLQVDADGLANSNYFVWDFLTGENPIHFSIYLYDSDINHIVTYKNKENNEIITLDSYLELSELEKATYEEIIDETVSSVLLLETSSQLEFDKILEDTPNGVAMYFSTQCDFSGLDEKLLALDFGDNKKNKTFRIKWDVVDNIHDVNGVESTYLGYQVVTQTNNIMEGPYIIDGQEYYIGYDIYDYFEYLNYFSKNGMNGEPAFVFPNASGIIGQTMKVGYSDLTDAQKTQIKSYLVDGTLDGLNHIVERYTYEMYEKFLNDKKNFENSLGYLEYGLVCTISFDLKIEQLE